MSKIILISSNDQTIAEVSEFCSSQGCEFVHYHMEEDLHKEKEEENSHKQEEKKSNVLRFNFQKDNEPPATYPQTLDEIIYESIKNTLYRTRGNIIQACRTLNITRSTLYRKILEFEIDLHMIRHQTRSKKRSLKNLKKVA